VTAPRELLDRAAAAIANARGARRGMPAIVNVLELLPEKLRAEVLDDAEAVLAALGLEQLRTAAGDALTSLENIGREPWSNGQTWADCGPVYKATLALRQALEACDGAPLPAPVQGGE
jgi:hypothetical protein